ncbi:hypothetical protein ACLMJK_007355 [Lecanora helva]
MVYRGPSGGCKLCRTRRVKCDQIKPQCKNCVRRGKICPGYDDVFDGAHRSQNQVVQRETSQTNPGRDNTEFNQDEIGTNGKNSTELVPKVTSDATFRGSGRAPRWIVYSSEARQPRSSRDLTTSKADRSPAAFAEVDSNQPAGSIPSVLQQSAQDASICFFFRYYGATSIDPEVRRGFNQLWKPMYLQASPQSSLRLATTAVTVNIAMMWCLRGCDTLLARSTFANAITAARGALSDPTQNSTDEMLMTILLFDLYDSLVLNYVPRPVDYGKHKFGALAMIKHRGSANYSTPRSLALIGAVRHTLLPHLLSLRKPFPEQSDHLFNHPLINDTKAAILDLISVRLSRVQSCLWTFRVESLPDENFERRRACYTQIIVEACQVEELLRDWRASITDPDWQAEYVLRESVMDLIQKAGFYGTRCSVWADLEIAGTWLSFYMRYLLTLQVVRQSFSDEASLLEDPEHQMLLARVNEEAQNLVDCICEMVPFYLGDRVVPENPMYETSINFPTASRIDQTTGRLMDLPRLKSNHHARAAAQGGWIVFPKLVNVWRLAEPEDDVVPIILRDGQLDWIKQQVRRLQNTFMFCEPVWFKRPKPSPARGNII